MWVTATLWSPVLLHSPPPNPTRSGSLPRGSHPLRKLLSFPQDFKPTPYPPPRRAHSAPSSTPSLCPPGGGDGDGGGIHTAAPRTGGAALGAPCGRSPPPLPSASLRASPLPLLLSPSLPASFPRICFSRQPPALRSSGCARGAPSCFPPASPCSPPRLPASGPLSHADAVPPPSLHGVSYPPPLSVHTPARLFTVPSFQGLFTPLSAPSPPPPPPPGSSRPCVSTPSTPSPQHFPSPFLRLASSPRVSLIPSRPSVSRPHICPSPQVPGRAPGPLPPPTAGRPLAGRPHELVTPVSCPRTDSPVFWVSHFATVRSRPGTASPPVSSSSRARGRGTLPATRKGPVSREATQPPLPLLWLRLCRSFGPLHHPAPSARRGLRAVGVPGCHFFVSCDTSSVTEAPAAWRPGAEEGEASPQRGVTSVSGRLAWAGPPPHPTPPHPTGPRPRLLGVRVPAPASLRARTRLSGPARARARACVRAPVPLRPRASTCARARPGPCGGGPLPPPVFPTPSPSPIPSPPPLAPQPPLTAPLTLLSAALCSLLPILFLPLPPLSPPHPLRAPRAPGTPRPSLTPLLSRPLSSSAPLYPACSPARSLARSPHSGLPCSRL
ncbi:basic proline-rich protein-like [Prionailurus viverrinus]|uniref:basic proline-rich protein-like n=1 Tax=Prionailurus viverrinus TaxID=61388 RepID=UPI001FF39B96|nr:basic proline-rich protein-like [Prionailurus viverrinus]